MSDLSLRPVLRALAPLLPIVALAAALTWLNRGPWWAWLLVAVLLGAVAAAFSRWRQGRRLVRFGAWALAAVVVGTVAVYAHPGPQERTAGGDHPQATQPVSTREGPITGVRNDEGTVEVFAGVPYAQPPVGDLRWRAPQPPQHRSAVLEADTFTPVPVQATTNFASRALSQVVEVPLESTFLNPFPTSEDSLTLNVWRPAQASTDPRPVMVFIPGGGFATGSGALPLYDGENLSARGDIITITVNYRLGVLGFLAHPELAAQSPHATSGNYGVLDQIAALEWIRANIASFGGDPERVTIAGESAGGESVCTLGATPLAEGLFDGIIGTSGACFGTTGDTEHGDQANDRATQEKNGQLLSEQLGDASIEEMRAMSAGRISDAAKELDVSWRPSVDGYVLPRSPSEIYASGEQLDVPLLTGSNADESSLGLASPPDNNVHHYLDEARETYGPDTPRFLQLYPAETEDEVVESRLQAQTDRVMTRAHHTWARTHSRTSGAPAWHFYFTHVPHEPGLERYGAYHGAEVGYVFDNLDAVGNLDPTEADLRLRDQMSSYWINFVRAGDPNAPSLTAWPTVTEEPDQVMEFGSSGAVMSDRPRAAAVDFWLDYRGPIA